MERWAGKVALVTGASAGIGAAVVEELTKSGMKVVGLARRVEKMEEIREKLKGESGELFPIKGDVSKIEDIEFVLDWIEKNFGSLDLLVNNAGITRDTLFTDMSVQQIDEVLGVNFRAVAILSQKAIQMMLKSNVSDGHIINISSVSGLYVPRFPKLNIYPATKHAVQALSETIRHNLQALSCSKIKVTNICPGIVATEIAEAALRATNQQVPEDFQKRYEKYPHLNASDIADAVAFVLGTPKHVQIHDLVMRHWRDSL